MIPDRHHARRRTLQRQAGFTLIELLVVISIIALLSSIILAALSTARGKSKDAAIKELAHQMQTVYALEYSKNNSYAGLKVGNLPLYCSTSAVAYSCQLTSPGLCTTFYGSGSEGEKVCLDVFNKGGTYFDIGTSVVSGTSDNFNTTYAVFIPYASNPNSNGRCLGSGGSASDQTNFSSCFATGIGW